MMRALTPGVRRTEITHQPHPRIHHAALASAGLLCMPTVVQKLILAVEDGINESEVFRRPYFPCQVQDTSRVTAVS